MLMNRPYIVTNSGFLIQGRICIIFEKSTRNQVTGYELTSRNWLRVDFLGTG